VTPGEEPDPDTTATPNPLSTALSSRYRIEREIGHGGMATVYLARDLRHERDVAVKVLNTDVAAIVGADRFLEEIKTTAHLKHPHILPLFDSGSAEARCSTSCRSSTVSRCASGCGATATCRSARSYGFSANWPTRWRTPTRRVSSTAT
jgi:hypothetical protein